MFRRKRCTKANARAIAIHRPRASRGAVKYGDGGRTMIVVTGASGLLGASVVLRAHAMGLEVAGFYHRHPLEVPGTVTRGVDLRDFSTTREVLLRLRPEAIIHCAAATNVEWCETHPRQTEEANVSASARLAEIACELNAHLTYISTDSVFDGQRGNYSETDAPAPLNIYARSKLAGEQEILKCLPSALIVRTNIYGWNVQEKLSVAEWFLRQLTDGEVVQGFTDIAFCPMFAHDLTDILLHMVNRRLGGLYHVTGSGKTSKYEFGRRVAAAFGFDPGRIVPSRIIGSALKARRPKDTSLSTEKVCQAMGCNMPDVEEGLRRFHALYDEGYPQQIKNYLTGAVA